MVPTWSQKPPKSSRAQRPQNGAKMAPRWDQDSEKIKEKRQRNVHLSKKRAGAHSLAPVEPKKWPTWPQLGSQNGAKKAKKSMQKSVAFFDASWHRFVMDFGRVWEAGWGAKPNQEQESFEKRIDKMMKNRCVLEAPGWGDPGSP